jgi:RHS repeat-associated protein
LLSAAYLNNRLVATGIVYDASGNMIQDGNHTYGYDADNRLISVDNGSTATYIYSADGLRVRSSVGAVVLDYIHDLDGNTVGVVGPGGTLVRQEFGGLATYSDAAYFHHRDWLGNLRAVTDQTGAIRKTCTNLPFGDALTCSTVGITPTAFTGYMRDSETNLDFANARYYTSQFGRFMSPDPLAGHALVPQSLNRYSYVLNTPLSAIDPSGMDLILACGPGTGHPCGGIGAGDGSGGVAGGPFTGGGTGGGPPFGICLYPCVGFSALGGRPAAPLPSAYQLMYEVQLANSQAAQGAYPLMLPGVVYGDPTQARTMRHRNWIGGCPLSTCHTYNGLFPPLTPILTGKGLSSFPAFTVLTLGAGALAEGFIAPTLTTERILANPAILKGLHPEAVEGELAGTAGWRIETLGKGSKAGQGWVFREYLPNGEASGRMIRWHPGGSRHYEFPHWTVSQPNVPTVRVPED